MALSTYGFGPEQLFYPASPLAGRSAPAPVAAAPIEQPSPIINDLFRDHNASPTPAAETLAHPNPSVGAALKSAATGLGLMSPMGLGMGLLSLAVTDALGMKPSFSRTDAMRGVVDNVMGRTNISSIQDVPTALGDKPAASLDVASIFSGGADKSGETNVTADYGQQENQSATNLAKGGIVELFGGGKVAVGPGGGMDDRIPTTIDGGRLANLSDGEFVIPADVVSAMGDGSTNAGATRLYDLVKAIRQQKTGSAEQARPVQFNQILRRVTR